jgi:hypothetical protein
MLKSKGPIMKPWGTPFCKICQPLTTPSKLAAYGLSSQSVKLLENYLTGRKQHIKLQGVVSGWQILQKGVPQGSIGSFFFVQRYNLCFF